MKYLGKDSNKLSIQIESPETQLIRAAFLNSGGAIIDGPSQATKDEVVELNEYFIELYKADVSRDQSSKATLTGRQLLLTRDVVSESLREIASFEFTMRHSGTEQDAATLLIAIKEIQDEAKDYGR